MPKSKQQGRKRDSRDWKKMYSEYSAQYDKSLNYAKSKGGGAAEKKLGQNQFKSTIISIESKKQSKTSWVRFSKDLARSQVISRGSEEAKKLQGSIEESNIYFEELAEELMDRNASREEINKVKSMVTPVPSIDQIRYGYYDMNLKENREAVMKSWYYDFKKAHQEYNMKQLKEAYSHQWFSKYGY